MKQYNIIFGEGIWTFELWEENERGEKIKFIKGAHKLRPLRQTQKVYVGKEVVRRQKRALKMGRRVQVVREKDGFTAKLGEV